MYLALLFHPSLVTLVVWIIGVCMSADSGIQAIQNALSTDNCLFKETKRLQGPEISFRTCELTVFEKYVASEGFIEQYFALDGGSVDVSATAIWLTSGSSEVAL